MLALDKIDPQFRKLVDQLFFTDRTDLDTSNFSALLGNKDEHFAYLHDRFTRSLEIFWDEAFWLHRFDLLLSLHSKRASIVLEPHLISQFRSLIIRNSQANINTDNAYIQFVAWSKAKSSRKEDVSAIRDFLLGLPHIIQINRLTGIVSNFAPHIFQSCDEYIEIISKKIGQVARNFEVLQQLEKQGLKIDKGPVFKLAKDLLLKRVPNRSNKRALFIMMEDTAVMGHLQSEYHSPVHRSRLTDLIVSCDYKELERHHLRNIKNLLILDATLADEILFTYLDSLYTCRAGYKRSNIKRLIRACKTFSQLSSKKVLAYLASTNRMSDIKYVLKAFPELKPLAPFI